MNPLSIWTFVTRNWTFILIGALALAVGEEHFRLWLCQAEYKTHLAADATAAFAAEQKARATESHNAEVAENINTLTLERNDAISKAAAAARDTARTRGDFVRVKVPRCDLPRTPANPSVGEAGTVEARLSDGDATFLNAFADSCAGDQGVADDGHNWALKVGK